LDLEKPDKPILLLQLPKDLKVMENRPQKNSPGNRPVGVSLQSMAACPPTRVHLEPVGVISLSDGFGGNSIPHANFRRLLYSSTFIDATQKGSTSNEAAKIAKTAGTRLKVCAFQRKLCLASKMNTRDSQGSGAHN
jgi:hypothetical protein